MEVRLAGEVSPGSRFVASRRASWAGRYSQDRWAGSDVECQQPADG